MNAVQPLRDRELIAAAKASLKSRSLRDWALLVCGLNFALRISDLLSLRVGDVSSRQGDVVDRFDVKQRKTKRPVSVHVSDNARRALTHYLSTEHPSPHSADAPLFPSRKRLNGTLRSLSRYQAYRIINSAVRQFAPDLVVGTHTLRKTWGWFAYRDGVPLATIMRKLGHQSPSTTLHYIGITDDDVRDATIQIDL